VLSRYEYTVSLIYLHDYIHMLAYLYKNIFLLFFWLILKAHWSVLKHAALVNVLTKTRQG